MQFFPLVICLTGGATGRVTACQSGGWWFATQRGFVFNDTPFIQVRAYRHLSNVVTMF